MTHDELLEKIRLKFFVNEEGATGSGYKESQLRNAVYAVVELHSYIIYKNTETDEMYEQCHECSGNGYHELYPCETIQAIEKELA